MLPSGLQGMVMGQVKKMQEQMVEIQNALDKERVEGSSGGGMVTTVFSGMGDLLEVKITLCDLGLLGFQRIRPKEAQASAALATGPLKAAILSAAGQGRLSCKSAWEIADRLGRARSDVAAACDGPGIKLSPCQLGAF